MPKVLRWQLQELLKKYTFIHIPHQHHPTQDRIQWERNQLITRLLDAIWANREEFMELMQHGTD